MTTQLSTQDLELWLAERLPELRKPLTWAAADSQTEEKIRRALRRRNYLDADIDRGWEPNVTLEGLLEALRVAGFTSTMGCYQSLDPAYYAHIVRQDGTLHTLDDTWATTLKEALMRAAYQALGGA